MPRAAARLLALLFGLLIGSVSPAYAEALKLDGTNAGREIGPFASLLVDPTGEMSATEAEEALLGDLFEPVQLAHFDAGYSITPHWIAVPIMNESKRDVAYLVSTNIPYIPALSVQLLRDDGASEVLLDKDVETQWRADQFLGQSVVSTQFLLAPAETATLLMRFEPYGIGVLPLSLETPQTAFEQAASNKLILFTFYSFALTSLALLFAFVLAIWHPGGVYYLGLFGCGLVMMAQLDGLLNEWLWPGWPEWNKVASFPLLLALCAAGLLTAAFMLRTGDRPRLAKMSRTLALVCVGPLLLVPVVEVAWLILVGFAFMVIAMGLLTYAIVNWAQLLPGKARIALIVGFAIFVAIGLILEDVLTGRGNLAPQNLVLVKILYMLISLIVLISYATHVAALNRAHIASVKRELSLARNEARINSELLDSERRYVHAKELVAKQRDRLANASHDLRQPITSLRLTLDSLTRNTLGESHETITRAFDYLDELVSDHLVETRERTDLPSLDDAGIETMAVSLITKTVIEMFVQEVTAKGLRFKHFDSGYMICAAPMPVMRIVSNLVSNAVKYSDKGGVLIGSKRRGDHIVIEVIDTGSGMTETELKTLSGRHRKGEMSVGEGLGLAICYELAAEQGFELYACSRPGRGTRFSLHVPSAAAVQ